MPLLGILIFERVYRRREVTLMINGKRIGVVVLNYNDADTTDILLRDISLYPLIDHIVIVDNWSTDHSFEYLKKWQSNRIDVLQTDKNGGYSYGNNVGAFFLIKKYNIDVLFIVNPDVIFTESFLQQIIDDMDSTSAKAASGYMVMPKHVPPIVINKKINTWKRETLECTIFLKKIFPYRVDSVTPHMGIQEVEWLPGSLFAIDAKVYTELGGLDDSVFLFFEEQILGRKFIDKGYKMILDTNISYYHNHSISINKSIKRLEQVKQLYRSKYYFYTNYERISLVQKLLMKLAIHYGIFSRRLIYKLIK